MISAAILRKTSHSGNTYRFRFVCKDKEDFFNQPVKKGPTVLTNKKNLQPPINQQEANKKNRIKK